MEFDAYQAIHTYVRLYTIFSLRFQVQSIGVSERVLLVQGRMDDKTRKKKTIYKYSIFS